jgi:hypothetical protein
MDKLRLSPGFDISPSGAPPTLPNDPMDYLNTLLAERKAREADDACKDEQKGQQAFNYFGVCPHCHTRDGFINVGRSPRPA